MSTRLWLYAKYTLASLVCVIAIAPELAMGAALLSWDVKLQEIALSMTGPFVRSIAVIALAVTGAMLAFGGELSDFARRISVVIMALSILVLGNIFVEGFLEEADNQKIKQDGGKPGPPNKGKRPLTQAPPPKKDLLDCAASTNKFSEADCKAINTAINDLNTKVQECFAAGQNQGLTGLDLNNSVHSCSADARKTLTTKITEGSCAIALKEQGYTESDDDWETQKQQCVDDAQAHQTT